MADENTIHKDSKNLEKYGIVEPQTHTVPRDCKPFLIALDWGFLCTICLKEYVSG